MTIKTEQGLKITGSGFVKPSEGSSGELHELVRSFLRDTSFAESDPAKKIAEALPVPTEKPTPIKLPMDPGSPGPNIGTLVGFELLAAKFVAAAASNNVAEMSENQQKMWRHIEVKAGSREKVYQKALLAAAKNDAFGATQYLLKEQDKRFAPFDSGSWQKTVEAAFITAVRSNSYDVVGFYLGSELGEEYQASVTLRPEILAWGIYRSSEGSASDELMTRVREVNPTVAEIYFTQIAFLSHAEEGNDWQLKDGIENFGTNSPFVFREAAEKAIMAGHGSTLELLIGHVPLNWTHRLIEVAAGLGRVDMVDCVIEQVKHARKNLQGGSLGIYLSGRQERSLEPYYDERLLETAIRGAVSGNQIDALDEFLSRAQETGRSKTAAIAAIKNNQLDVLKRVLSNVPPEPREEAFELTAAYAAEEPKTGMSESDQKLLKELMTEALQTGNSEARDFLLREKGAVNCVSSKHIEEASKAQDEDSLRAIIEAGPQQLNAAFALSCLSHADNFKEADKHPICLEELFTLCSRANMKEHDRARRDVVEGHLADAFKKLGFANQHQLISIFLKTGEVSEKAISGAFIDAVGGASKESFDILLPLAKAEDIDKSFKAVCGRDRGWQPRKEARAFLTELIAQGSKDPENLIRGAVCLANDEDFRRVEGCPGALSILQHPDFPAAGYSQVLREIGLRGNQPIMDELRGKPGVSDDLIDFLEAVLNKDLERIRSLLSKAEAEAPELVTEAATKCLGSQSPFLEGADYIIQNAADLNLDEVAMSAIYAKNAELLKQLVDKGLSVTKEHLDRIVYNKLADLLECIMQGRGARVAALDYLRSFDEDRDSMSERWLEKRREMISALRSYVE